ncbi:zinc-binding dehydrogenase [Leucobacter sp. BZR 635]
MVWSRPGAAHEAVAIDSVELSPGDALVAIEYATVCGSDLHTVSGRRSAPAPLVLGHEQVGRVVALGTGASRSDGQPLALGERVVWSLTVSCGDCDRCQRGLTQKCRTLRKFGHERFAPEWQLSGGFASHVQLLAGTTVAVIPEEFPVEIAAPLSCGTATAVAAVDAAAQVTELAGATVLVTGAGLVGLTAMAIARDRGARVIAADPDPHRRALALRFGAVAAADPLLDASEPGSLSSVLAELGAAEINAADINAAAHHAPDGVHAVIEASGSASAVSQALGILAIGGVAVLVGSVAPAGTVPLDPEAIVRGVQTIRGVHNYTPAQLEAAVRYLAERHTAYPFRELVGAERALGELDDAITLAAAGGAVRVGIRIGHAGESPGRYT